MDHNEPFPLPNYWSIVINVCHQRPHDQVIARRDDMLTPYVATYCNTLILNVDLINNVYKFK